jgi:RNA polymerase-binding transcription factor DksA
MPDFMDSIQDLVLREQDEALARVERQRERQSGVPECLRCDEPISTLRQGLGARLCLECQADEEARHRAPRVRR